MRVSKVIDVLTPFARLVNDLEENEPDTKDVCFDLNVGNIRRAAALLKELKPSEIPIHNMGVGQSGTIRDIQFYRICDNDPGAYLGRRIMMTDANAIVVLDGPFAGAVDKLDNIRRGMVVPDTQ